MTRTPKLDGRRLHTLEGEMERRAVSVLSGDGQALPVGQVARAIIGVAARIGEEVTIRLDRVPEKQTDNFYAAMGIGRDAASPAHVPVMFKVANPAPTELIAPSATRLMATTSEPVIFETETAIALVPGTLTSLWAVDSARDAIYAAPPLTLAHPLPQPDIIRRALRGGAGAGATRVQIDPTVGLASGAVLAIGGGTNAPQHVVVEVKDDVVTIAPPLAQTFDDGAFVVEVATFAPYAGSRDRQSHNLYIGHSTLLDVPSAVDIVVSGVPLPTETEWSWFGEADDGAQDWRLIKEIERQGARVTLKKTRGKPGKTSIHGIETHWLRARLPGPSTEAVELKNIRLAVGGSELCPKKLAERCNNLESSAPEKRVDYDAIAVTTPVVTNQPFRPFGLEPRIFDSFYIGCAEAFSKAGAEVSLCFKLGGPELGPLAWVGKTPTWTSPPQTGFRQLFYLRPLSMVFGVGTDGFLYSATFGWIQPRLAALPLPRADGRKTPFLPNAPVAARLVNGFVEICVGDEDGVHFAQIAFNAAPPKTINWIKFNADKDVLEAIKDAPRARPRLHVTANAPPVTYALFGDTLHMWSASGQLTKRPGVVLDLITIYGDTADPVLILEKGKDDKVSLSIERGGNPAAPFIDVRKEELPSLERVAWTRNNLPDPLDGATIYIAGFDNAVLTDDKIKDQKILRLVKITKGKVEKIFDFPSTESRPIGFERPSDGFGDWPPTLILATPTPMRIIARPDADASSGTSAVYTPIATDGYPPIGVSDNPYRKIETRFGKTIVQDADQGLLHTEAGVLDLPINVVSVDVRRLLKITPVNLDFAGAKYVAFDSSATPHPTAYELIADSAGREWLLKPLVGWTPPTPSDANGWLFAETETGGQLNTHDGAIDLDRHDATEDVDILLTVVGADIPRNGGIWHLVFDGANAFRKPQGFPQLPIGGRFEYKLLLRRPAQILLRDVVEPKDPKLFDKLVEPLRSYYDSSTQISSVLKTFGPVSVFELPHKLVDKTASGYVALIIGAPSGWSTLGQSLPANPALSWEYWNGHSWWALEERKLLDDTANLLVTGGVSFIAPPDIKETEVGGRDNYWIRARLIGGDYGQAKVTVTTAPGPNSTTEQTIDRDLSTIRSPNVIKLDIIYCAQTLVLPETVLTEDSLGAANQTNANDAGLPIRAFVPVRELMNPTPEPQSAGKNIAETCEEPCPPPQSKPPSPCDAPGAYDSCDSPCRTPPDTGGTTAAPAGVERALLIGFNEPLMGDPVSLYIDAEPGAAPTTLVAETVRGERFHRLAIVEDGSYGLSEPGRLSLSMAAPSEASELFGVTAHWIRLGPRAGETNWSPHLRGVYPNAVTARSVETRALESLGASSGAPNQFFRLAGAPLDPRSLKLLVREPVGEEEAKTLDIVPEVAGMPGPWILWRLTEDFAGSGSGGRVYKLNAETGEVSFGDGVEGAIPPLGGEVLAVVYQKVTGDTANNVLGGAELQLLSPIAGIDNVVALRQASGGSDVETAVKARVRAAPKLRRGDRVITLDDIEDFARGHYPLIAQTRAKRIGAVVRLIVALRGQDVLPAPAFLRELEAAVRAAASFGVARPGALVAIGPRLLPISIGVELIPDDAKAFADIAVAANKALAAYFDAAVGGEDRRGWRIGKLPQNGDVAAALGDLPTTLGRIVITRGGEQSGAPAPDRIAEDMLARVAVSDIRLVRTGELAA